MSASDVIRRLQPQLAQVAGHHALHAAGAGPDGRRPRQPHAVSVQPRGRRCRTSCTPGRRGCVEKLQTLPELRDVASDQQNGGLQATLVIDRDTASRLGITPQMIDDTLYDAFGQRQVSTIFTQLNQYRVVLEVQPELPAEPGGAEGHLRPLGQRGAGAAERLHARRADDHGAGGQPPGAVSRRSRSRSTWRPGVALGRRGHARSPPPSARSGCPPASAPASRARRRPSRPRSPTSRC